MNPEVLAMYLLRKARNFNHLIISGTSILKGAKANMFAILLDHGRVIHVIRSHLAIIGVAVFHHVMLSCVSSEKKNH